MNQLIFRQFKNDQIDDGQFTIYSIAVGVIGLFTSSLVITLLLRSKIYEFAEKSILMLIASIFIAILVWFSQACYYLVKHSTSLKSSDKIKFETEKSWFWSFLAMLPMVTVNWYTELALLDDRANTSDVPSILADLIKLLTAVNILVFFVMRENVKFLILQKYQMFQRSVSTQSA